MVFHRKSSQKVYSRFPFLGQEEQQTGHLSGSEQEQCHLRYTAGLFRVQHRAGGGQCGSFSLLSVFPKFHGDKNHLGAGGVNVWIAYTHPQAPLSDCASEGLGWDAGNRVFIMLFKPYYQASWRMAENSWEPSGLKVPLPGNSQIDPYVNPSSIKYLSSAYKFCSTDTLLDLS